MQNCNTQSTARHFCVILWLCHPQLWMHRQNSEDGISASCRWGDVGSLSCPHPETDRPGSLSDLALETIQFAGLSFDPASLCEPLLLTYRWLRSGGNQWEGRGPRKHKKAMQIQRLATQAKPSYESQGRNGMGSFLSGGTGQVRSCSKASF